MALFVVRHQHSADTCPAGDPEMGPMLVSHLSKANAASLGIRIHGEAVIHGHALYMILDAPDQERVQEFLAPSSQAGTVGIWRGDPCETAVARGNCDVV